MIHLPSAAHASTRECDSLPDISAFLDSISASIADPTPKLKGDATEPTRSSQPPSKDATVPAPVPEFANLEADAMAGHVVTLPACGFDPERVFVRTPYGLCERFFKGDLYPVERTLDASGNESITFAHHPPVGGVRRFSIPSHLLDSAKAQGLRKLLRGQGVHWWPREKGDTMVEYIKACVIAMRQGALGTRGQ